MLVIQEKIVCDCGHMESEHSSFTRGYATTRDGKTMCYDCCHEEDKRYLLSAEKVFFYISSDGKKLTNWPGKVLGKVVHWGAFHPFSRERRYVRVRDVHGQYWYGTGDDGMWASLRKCKPQKAGKG